MAIAGITLGLSALKYAQSRQDAKRARRTDQQNIQRQDALNKQSQKNYQADVKRNSIGQRVKDAKAAGISPLAAMGGVGNAAPANLQFQPSKHVPTPNIGNQASSAMAEYNALTNQKLREETNGVRLQNELAKHELLKRKASLGVTVGRVTDPELPTPTKITAPYGTMNTSASTPQQIVEDEYGGIIGEGYGISRFLSDYFGVKNPRKPPKGYYTRKPLRGER